jgi:hypothetical protein
MGSNSYLNDLEVWHRHSKEVMREVKQACRA